MTTFDVLGLVLVLIVTMYVLVATLRQRRHPTTVPKRVAQRVGLLLTVVGLASFLLLGAFGKKGVLPAPQPLPGGNPVPRADTSVSRLRADSARDDSLRLARDIMAQGITLVSRGRLSQALGVYDSAIALDSSLATAYGYKGYALLRLGRVPEALETMHQGLVRDTTDPWAYYNYALAWYQKRDLDSALGAARSVLRLDCSFAATMESDVQYRALLRNITELKDLIRRCDSSL
jgi:tetratricopeptide (TPR) repeat protein